MVCFLKFYTVVNRLCKNEQGANGATLLYIRGCYFVSFLDNLFAHVTNIVIQYAIFCLQRTGNSSDHHDHVDILCLVNKWRMESCFGLDFGTGMEPYCVL